MADLTQAQEAEKFRKSQDLTKRRKVIQKIQMMRVTEFLAAGGTSAAVGAITKWKPELKTTLYGFAQPAAIGLLGGGVGYLVTKDGYLREGVGGVAIGCFSLLMQDAGGKLYDLITAP